MLYKPLFPQLFKGIALFTPGGDLIYSIDPNKQGHWHLHLCAGLQEILGLPEPPHFLVPGYTATIDRWIDPQTQQLRMSAETYWPVRHHQGLLNAVFGTGNLVWQVAPWQEESCNPIVLETYRHQFPQLWEDHDLIVRFDRTQEFSHSAREGFVNTDQARWSLNVSEAVAQKLPPEARSASPTASRTNSETRTNSEDIDAHSQPLTAHAYVLRLFVSGHSAATESTLQSLHHLLEGSLRHPYTLKVIDIFKHPDQAEANQILATPTLLRVWPQPVRRIVGNLNNAEQVLRVLAAPEVYRS